MVHGEMDRYYQFSILNDGGFIIVHCIIFEIKRIKRKKYEQASNECGIDM